MNSISPMIDDTGARTGIGTSGGRDACASWSFSETICRAPKTSKSPSNSTHTIAMPIPVDERTRRTPAAPFMALSIGSVTRLSTSSGAIP